MDEVMFGQGMLERAAASVQYPSTPQLRARVLARIAAPPIEARERRPAWALPALAAAISLVAAAGASLAVPGSREAIADFFGIEGSKLEPLPRPPVGTTPTPFPTPQDIDSGAVPSSLEQARTRAFDPALPGRQQPDAVYLVQYGVATGVILRFADFDLWEVDGDGAFEGGFGKGAPAGVTITDTTVNGHPARWIGGGPHFVEYYDADGHRVSETARTVERNTLIWRTDFALYRLETDLSLEDALAIAESLP